MEMKVKYTASIGGHPGLTQDEVYLVLYYNRLDGMVLWDHVNTNVYHSGHNLTNPDFILASLVVDSKQVLFP